MKEKKWFQVFLLSIDTFSIVKNTKWNILNRK